MLHIILESGPEKMHCHFTIESCSFHQNAHKLTGNMKNRHFLNIVIKYSLSGSWQGNYLKSINTGNIFRAVKREEKFANSESFLQQSSHFQFAMSLLTGDLQLSEVSYSHAG